MNSSLRLATPTIALFRRPLCDLFSAELPGRLRYIEGASIYLSKQGIARSFTADGVKRWIANLYARAALTRVGG
jgi:hypothetical protein